MLSNNNTLEGQSKQRPLSSFIRKLWFILTDKDYEQFIFWVDNGQVICIPNSISFSDAILPKFFKHNNWQSFVRQLNLYGFRKVYQLNLSYDDTFERRTVWHFKHYCFQKNRPEKLFDIKRRATNKIEPERQEDTKPDMMSPQYSVTEKQDKVEKELKDLKRKLAEVDEKSQDLLQQVINLNTFQTNQKEAIKLLSKTIVHLINNNPNMTIKEKSFSTIVESLLQTPDEDEINELEEDDELEEEVYVEVHNIKEDMKNPFYLGDKEELDYIPNITINTHSQHIIRPLPAKDSTIGFYRNMSPYTPSTTELPSISSLFRAGSSEMLPPIKRHKAA